MRKRSLCNVDHEIVECWDDRENRWRLVDADLLDVTIRNNHIEFDIYDIPRDRFIVAGKAWQMCRAGEADSNAFGSEPETHKGMRFIRNRLLHDFIRLNKMELIISFSPVSETSKVVLTV
jgi:hypothetical protein